MPNRSGKRPSALAARLRDLIGHERVTEWYPREADARREPPAGDRTEPDLSILGMKAPLLVQPGDVGQLAATLSLACSERLGACVAGGGSKLAWGNRPDRLDLLVTTQGLCTPCTVDAEDLTMTAAAGVTLAEARARARAMNRLLPLDGGDPSRATVGGITATGDQGPRGAQFGRVRDLVLGLKATLADGTPVAFGGKTMKNVAGYDMTKLFSGSFGALGVITETTLRLLPLPETEGLLACSLPSLAQARDVSAKILGSCLQPLALEVASPRVAAALVPKLPARCRVDADEPLFLAAFAGHPAALERSLADVCRWLDVPAQTTLRDAEADTFLDALADLSAATAAQVLAGEEDGQRELGLAARAFVPISEVWPLAEAAESLARAAGLPLAFRIGAGRGTLDLWVDAQPDVGPRSESLAPWVADLRKVTVASGGQLMVTGRPAFLADSIDAWTDPGPALQLMQRLKERFDPHRTLNPGRFVGGL
jgi:glycolate oxidase FAD binding subunit